MFEKTHAMLDQFLEMGIPGVDLLAYRDGQEAFRCFKGFTDREGTIPMTGKERYAMYSLSKPITCTAAMQLWEKGLFSLEDRLSDYLPEFTHMKVQTPEGIRDAKNPIRIHNLFEMTAGLNYDISAPWVAKAQEATGGKCPTRETIRFLAENPLDYEPGMSWKYSLCHDVLAALVEVISGQRYRDYIKEHIFDPLGMERSTFNLPEMEADTLATHYQYRQETGEYICSTYPHRYKLGPEYDSGGAGLVSTVEDYIRFAEALRVGDVILGKDTIRLMTTDRLNDVTRPARNSKKYGYGLGMRCPMGISPAPYTDFGWGGAAGAYLMVDIPKGITIVYAQHVVGGPNTSLRNPLCEGLSRELMNMD